LALLPQWRGSSDEVRPAGQEPPPDAAPKDESTVGPLFRSRDDGRDRAGWVWFHFADSARRGPPTLGCADGWSVVRHG
jgi:hypothetical protein